MAKSYLITGPLHVANKKPGDTVTSDELTDAGHLLSIGFIEVVKSGSAKKPESSDAGIVESKTDSVVESEPVSSQEKL
ncbi:MAG: hypothetical protein WCG15_00560 [Actinomycetes bacterium]